MLSKRDVQLVRLAVRWKWISPEHGEDLLFLKRKFGDKLTVEEIIRRRGYINDEELDQLIKSANQLVGRRGRAAAGPAPRASEQRAARSEQATQPRAPARPPIEAPSTRMNRLSDAASSSPQPPASPSPSPSQKPVRRGAIPDRAQTVVSMMPTHEPEVSVRLKSERETEWQVRAHPKAPVVQPPPVVPDSGSRLGKAEPPVDTSRSRPFEPLGEGEIGEIGDFDDLNAPTVVTMMPEAVRQAIARAAKPQVSEPEPERTMIADPAQIEEMRRILEARTREEQGFEPTIVPDDQEMQARLREDRARAERRIPAERTGRGRVSDRAQRSPQAPEPTPIVEPVLPPREPSRIAERPAIPRGRSQMEFRVRSLFDADAGRSLPGEPVELDLLRAPPPAITPAEPIEDQQATVAAIEGFDEEGFEGEEEEEDVLHGQIGPYEIGRVISRGRRGVLYRAKFQDGTPLALKVLSPDEKRARDFMPRLVEAVARASKINSPYVVRVVDAGELDGRPYVAMQYVDAWTLEERVDSGDRPDLLESLNIARGVARALDAAAAQGVVHRDVNPDNILVGRSGEVHLTGFALPKELKVGTAPLSSGDAPLYGTAGYMAPEQVLGGSVDHRADLYALGATLFHMVTGRRVFEGNDATAILAKVTREPAPKVRDVDPAVPEIAAAIIDRAIALHRDQRFASAAELILALDQAIAKLQVEADAGAIKARREARRAILTRTAAASAGILVPAVVVPLFALKWELIPWTASRFALHEALGGCVALIFALILLSGLALVRRGELPLPMSSAWLVRLQDATGAAGATLLVAGLSVGTLAVLNLMVSVVAGVVLASWIYGILLRRAIAFARPDRGVGRMLAVLGDPRIAKWRLVHVPLLATLALLATARWAFLAYFAASAGL